MTKEAPFDDTLPPYEQVGYTYVTRGRTITESDILTHAGQTGDLYPLHMDAEAAKKSAYRQRVAHGTLVFSIATGLKFDMTIHDRISYGYDRVRFVKPVFIGDTLRVCVTVTEFGPGPAEAATMARRRTNASAQPERCARYDRRACPGAPVIRVAR